MNDPKDIEALAALEHESWSGWTSWMLGQIEKEKSGDLREEDLRDYDLDEFINGLPCIKRWRRQMVTPYAQLSEKEKESDRKEVREKIKVYRGETQMFRSSVEILAWHPEAKDWPVDADDNPRLLTVTNRKWGGFSCPGGKVDRGEKLIDAARREFKEETGCEALNLSQFKAGVHYEEPKDGGPPWFCMAFWAELGDQIPSQQEEGTEIGWHTPVELMESSIYPEWYKYLFAQVDLGYELPEV